MNFEVFTDLIRPQFRAEPLTVRIRSTIQLLRSCLETLRSIDICLRTGDDTVARAQLPLHRIVQTLKQKPGIDKTFDVLTEEFVVRLSPICQATNQQSTIVVETSADNDCQPCVEFHVALARETSMNGHKPTNARQARTRTNSAVNRPSSVPSGDNDTR
jgi:AhpD family alkylhydroperoxidase